MRDWWALMEQRGTREEMPMTPQVVAWHLSEALADDAIVCGDSGQVTYWVTALEHPGPVLVEAIVDPNEPPLPAKITPDQAKALGEALARGEEHRRRIGLTIGRQLIDERTFASSPYGVTERVKETIAGALGGDGDDE